MSKKYYSDNELIESCLFYFNLRVPFTEKDFIESSRREKAKWHPDKAARHRKDEFTTYFQNLSPVSDVISEKIKSNPALFQKSSHAYTSQHIGQQKPVTQEKTALKSAREEELEAESSVKNLKIQRLEAEVFNLKKNVLEKENLLKTNTLAFSNLKQENSHISAQLKESGLKIQEMTTQIEKIQKQLSGQASLKEVLSVVGLQKQAGIFSEENIKLAKSVVNGVGTVFTLLKK